MASLTDGTYQLMHSSGMVLTLLVDPSTAAPESLTHLLPPGEGHQRWTVTRDDAGTYTIRAGELCLGFEGQPDHFELVRMYAAPRAWRLTDGPAPGTYTIGLDGTDLHLGMGILRVFPPMAALVPPRGDASELWTLDPVG